MILLSVIITNVIMNRIKGYENSLGRFSLKIWLTELNKAKYALSIPIIILGGIYSGVFTPTESAAVAAAVAITFGLAQGRLKITQFPAMLGTSARVCGVILPIIAVALLFAQALTVMDVPQKFVAGVMETGPNIVVLGPLLMPLAQKIGMDPIHFCIFMVTTLGLGFITPPFGLNLFVMSGLTRTPVSQIAKHAFPFVIAMIIASATIGFIPWISLFTLR